MATVPISTDDVQQSWRARGYRAQVRQDPPGREWRNFRSDVDERIMLLDGEVEVEISGNILRLKPGEEVVVPAGATHTLRTLGDHPSRRLQGSDCDIPQTD
jgi:uncharacterized cupin superfamily protein